MSSGVTRTLGLLHLSSADIMLSHGLQDNVKPGLSPVVWEHLSSGTERSREWVSPPGTTYTSSPDNGSLYNLPSLLKLPANCPSGYCLHALSQFIQSFIPIHRGSHSELLRIMLSLPICMHVYIYESMTVRT